MGTNSVTPVRSFFAQQDHKQVFKLALGCLAKSVSSKFGLLVLNVIRQVGWLRRCSLTKTIQVGLSLYTVHTAAAC